MALHPLDAQREFKVARKHNKSVCSHKSPLKYITPYTIYCGCCETGSEIFLLIIFWEIFICWEIKLTVNSMFAISERTQNQCLECYR